MANSRNSKEYCEYATVDTKPTSAGYFTNPICPRTIVSGGKTIGGKIYFSIRETESDISAAPSALSSVTVVLQYKNPDDEAWTDFVPLDGSSLAIGNRVLIEESANGVLWRAGVASDGFTSGSVTFGFDW
jgi:hypothetical protein